VSEEVSKIDLVKEEVSSTSGIVGDLVLEFEKLLEEEERKNVEDMIRDSRETWFPAKLIIKWEEKREEGIIKLVAVGGVNYVTLYDKGEGYYEEERLFLLIKTIKDVFPKLAKQGKLRGFPFAGQWFDVGNVERYELAKKKWKGVSPYGEDE